MVESKECAYLKHYFGTYFVSVPEEHMNSLLKKFSEDSLIYYLHGRKQELREAGCVFLSHNKTYLNCFKIRGYDLIEFFLQHTETQNSPTFYDIPEQNLIIYHLAGTTSNIRLISLIRHVSCFRALEGKRTLILSEEEIFNELQDGENTIVNLKENIEEIINDF